MYCCCLLVVFVCFDMREFEMSLETTRLYSRRTSCSSHTPPDLRHRRACSSPSAGSLSQSANPSPTHSRRNRTPYRGNGRFLRDPRENVHGLAIQQGLVLFQLIVRQSVHLFITAPMQLTTFSVAHFPRSRSTSSMPRWRER